jgi:hypothetical protein
LASAQKIAGGGGVKLQPQKYILENTLYNISWGKLCQSNLDALFYQFLGPLFENESGKINLSKFPSVDITNMMIPSLKTLLKLRLKKANVRVYVK